eukprot:Nitzschia sp. Nitz4//scaffold11_size288233//53058//54188//NITZ4_000743-RA/size288233-snap-gene-0.8-mRNA-1//1//CDS//3329533981//9307//frame0
MESTPELAAEGAAIIKVLADVLERLVLSNADLARQDPGQITKFHALKAPGIGILQYLERIHKFASCSNECFILALIYIDRLIQRNNFLLTDLNVHRVAITAILLAAKFFDDAYYNNAYYAKVGGVLVAEMNGLEVDFLFRINFSLHVTPDEFDKYKAELVSRSVNAAAAYAVAPGAPPVQQVEIPVMSMMSQVHGMAPPPHLMPQHVTPSPSDAVPNVDARHVYAVAALEQQQNVYAVDYAVEQQILCNELARQQLLQRSTSLPPISNANACVGNANSNNNPPYNSAPAMMPMAPVAVEDQYMMLRNQLLPLQTTLVHHHHGLGEPVAFQVQTAGGPVHPLSNSGFGSLLAGRY